MKKGSERPEAGKMGKQRSDANSSFLWLFSLLFCFLFSFPVFAAERAVRDPFQAKVSAPAPKTAQAVPEAPLNVVLEGISLGPNGAFAVIGGEIYYEGEEKGGIKVTQIRKREVDILMNGVPQVLQMVVQEKTMSPAKESVEPAAEETKPAEAVNCDPMKGCV
jgi:hypothetical protein